LKHVCDRGYVFLHELYVSLVVGIHVVIMLLFSACGVLCSKVYIVPAVLLVYCMSVVSLLSLSYNYDSKVEACNRRTFFQV